MSADREAPFHFDADGRLRSRGYGDVYFSGDGLQETEHVFVQGNDLRDRFRAARGTFVIGETGFGTGLNFLVAAHHFLERAPASARLVFISTEQHPLPVDLLQAMHERLPGHLQKLATAVREGWSGAIEGEHVRVSSEDDRIVLHVLLGDALTSLQNHTFEADAWFLDGFAPDRNPRMWSYDLVREVACHTVVDGTFATYTVAGQVRRAAKDAGFAVERAAGFGKKREMLRGTRRLTAKDPETMRTHGADIALPRRVHVLGAGIAGASAAHAFARRGANVTVIDPAGTASGASGIEAAIVRPRLWVAGNRAPDAELVADAFRFTRAWLERHADEHFRACGALLCATTQDEAQQLRRRVENPATAELVTWLPPAQAAERAGMALPHGAAWIQGAGTCNLAGLVPHLLQAENIQVRPDIPAEDADLTIVATGRPPGDRWATRDARPVRGQAIARRPSSRTAPPRTASPRTAPPRTASPRTVICTSGYCSPPQADGTTWIGSTFDRDDDDRAPRQHDDERIVAHFAPLDDMRDALADAPTSQRFVGIRFATETRLPMVGELDRDTRTLASFAHGSRGAVTAPWAAHLLLASVHNDPLPLRRDDWLRLSPVPR